MLGTFPLALLLQCPIGETSNIVKQLYSSKINLKIIKGWGKCITTIKKKKKKKTTLESQTLLTKQEQVLCRYLDILN